MVEFPRWKARREEQSEAPPALDRCPVCRAVVTQDDRPLRLHGDLAVHRRCAGYRVDRGHVPSGLRLSTR